MNSTNVTNARSEAGRGLLLTIVVAAVATVATAALLVNSFG